MTRNLPRPVNQFNRLIHVSGAEPTGTYSLGSRWNNIVNGQNWDGRNCTAAMGALLIDAHTGGKKTSSPPQIRNHQNDWSGGIGWDDVNVSLSALFGIRLAIPTSADWYDVLGWLKSGHAVGIQGDYDQVPYDYQCQKGGTFDHAFALAGYRTTDGRVLRFDPLCKNASWVPQSAIRSAAEKLALVQRGTKGRLFVMLTGVMPLIVPTFPPVTYRYGGEPRFRGRYLARRDNVPVRSKPSPTATKVAELDYRQDFACRQSAASGRWLGNADGTKWVYKEVMWYAGGLTGNEVIE